MLTVRDAVLDDVEDIARIHVQAWRETYRGLVPDERLDDPAFVEHRREMWDSTFATQAAGRPIRVAVAAIDDAIVGFASVGPSRDDDLPGREQLWTLYSLASSHGSGAGAALVRHLLADRPAFLWVAEQNPRARAFYRKMGFAEDGTTLVDDGLREVRMAR